MVSGRPSLRSSSSMWVRTRDGAVRTIDREYKMLRDTRATFSVSPSTAHYTCPNDIGTRTWNCQQVRHHLAISCCCDILRVYNKDGTTLQNIMPYFQFLEKLFEIQIHKVSGFAQVWCRTRRYGTDCRAATNVPTTDSALEVKYRKMILFSSTSIGVFKKPR